MKKYKSRLILVFCSIVPLLFTSTIPFAAYTRLYVDSLRGNEHGWTGEQLLYVITLESGSEYTIIINSGPWDMDISLRIGETPYMINGLSVDSGSTYGEIMHFTPSKSGEYYIQMRVKSGSGFFYIEVESGTTNPASGENIAYFDVSYLLVLLLPTVFILAVGLLIFKRIAARPERKPFINVYRKGYKVEKEPLAINDDLMICEFCGVEINKHLKKCPNCQRSLK